MGCSTPITRQCSTYPEDAKEDAGKGLYYWALARESYIGLTYNKNLLSKTAVPKNFDGLFHRQLKGKMGISIGSATGAKIIGAMIKSKGEEFVKKLKDQNIKLYSIDPPALVNVIASGERSSLRRRSSKAIPCWPPPKVPLWSGFRWIWSPITSAAPRFAAKPPHPHAALDLRHVVGCGGPARARKISLRERYQKPAIQALAAGAGTDDGEVRERGRLLGKLLKEVGRK